MKFINCLAIVIAVFFMLSLLGCSDDEDNSFLIYNNENVVTQNITVNGNTQSIELTFNVPISESKNFYIDISDASTEIINESLIILLQKNDSDKDIVIPVTISYNDKVKRFQIIQKAKTHIIASQPYYIIPSSGGIKTIEVNLSSKSKCNCAMVYDGELFASIINTKQIDNILTIELNIDYNAGLGRACGLSIKPEDGDEVVIGLWQQPRKFTENESFEVVKAGRLGVLLGDDIRNYTFLRNISISGSLNANDINAIKKLFSKYTYDGLPKPKINLDLKWSNISDSSNEGYYEKFGGIGNVSKENQIIFSINTISSEIFQQSENLISVILPPSVEKIDRSAFRFCVNLESVSLPLDCKIIGEYAFFNCSKLTHIESYYQNDYCRITAIGDYAFSGIGQLDYLILPNELTYFNSHSLLGFNVKNLYVLKQTPPDINIYGIYKDCVLFVPKGSTDEYKNSNQWGKFTNIREISDLNDL
ncbi:MAG: leucine-rich repeat domain-containing protein [Bacteroidales bacterium]|nr:leucine-rich repeat domain-containing protein [Bacteroidales bacterium]